MNYRWHLGTTLIAALALVLASNHYGIYEFDLMNGALFVILASLSSLLNDIDQPNSKFNQFFVPLVVIAVSAVSFHFLGITAEAIIAIIITLVILGAVKHYVLGGHRGNAHKLGFAVIVALPTYFYIGLIYALAVAFGCFAHSVEDFIADRTGIGRGER